MTHHTNKTDCTLVELTLLGNESACEELILRHECAVMGTAYKVTNNTHSAEDASEDESGTVIFRNALGTQDRTNYEAAVK